MSAHLTSHTLVYTRALVHTYTYLFLSFTSVAVVVQVDSISRAGGSIRSGEDHFKKVLFSISL